MKTISMPFVLFIFHSPVLHLHQSMFIWYNILWYFSMGLKNEMAISCNDLLRKKWQEF
jgi:hypothetical protein